MKKPRLIAETAIMIALLVVLQAVTKSMGQFVTGSCVNLVLAVSTLTGGLICGVIVAIVSPFFAFLLGIGTPIIQIVPGIAAGNLVFVLCLYFIVGPALKKSGSGKAVGAVCGVIAAALVKLVVLWAVVTKLLIPLAGLPEAQAAKLATTFSWPQLITALIGGFLALVIVPLLNKALKR